MFTISRLTQDLHHKVQIASSSQRNVTHEGCAATGFVPCQRNTRKPLSKLEGNFLPRKIDVTSKSPVGDISVVTLIRTDTTLDHSQKAEKV
jgi:hypothetical protein